MNKTTLALLFAILSTAFYALMDASIKWTLTNYNVPITVFYAHVNIVLCVSLGLYLLIKSVKKTGENNFIIKVKLHIMLYRTALAFSNFYLAYIILKSLPLFIYYSVIFTVPTVASILSVIILKEKLSYLKIIALFIGLSGVFIITNPFAANFSIIHIIPILLTLLLAITLSLSMITTRQFFSKYDTIQLSFYIFLVGSILSVTITTINERSFISILNFDYNIIMVFVVAVVTLLGIILFIQAYKNASTSILAPTEYLFIVWGIILGKLIFNDTITTAALIGAAVVITSNVIIFLESKLKKVRNHVNKNN